MSPSKTCWHPNLRMDLGMSPYLEIGSLRGNRAKMRLLGWAVIQYDWSPYLKREGRETWTQTCTGGDLHVKRKVEPGDTPAHQGKPKTASMPAGAGRGAGTDFLSQPPEGTHPANFLFLGLLSSGTKRQSTFGKAPGQRDFVNRSPSKYNHLRSEEAI